MMEPVNIQTFWRDLSLERQLIAFGTTWIDYISFDPAHGVVVLQLVALLDGDQRRTAVVFEDVHEYSASWDDDQEPIRGVLDGEDLIGLDELVSSSGTYYIINTDCREVSFVSTTQPKIWTHVNAA